MFKSENSIEISFIESLTELNNQLDNNLNNVQVSYASREFGPKTIPKALDLIKSKPLNVSLIK